MGSCLLHHIDENAQQARQPDAKLRNYGDTLPFTLFSVRATLSAWLGSQESSSPAFRTT
jgi:hypothetical protein